MKKLFLLLLVAVLLLGLLDFAIQMATGGQVSLIRMILEGLFASLGGHPT